MKKLVLAIVLLVPSFACAEKPQPNPADYTVTVHVTASRLLFQQRGAVQRLNVVIDSKKYVLEITAGLWLVETGDYKARIVEDSKPKPGKGTSSEYHRRYEIMFPDGVTRGYDVVGEEE